MGDILVRLYPEECPKSVENFVVHAKNGYYDNLIFHRVIKGFMIQTGDPNGDGTGGNIFLKLKKKQFKWPIIILKVSQSGEENSRMNFIGISGMIDPSP
jgi:cyclophilin family peptidyl-prolyl cis-trans isomerase